MFGLIPVIDLLIGDDRRNPPEEAEPRLAADGYYRWLTYLYLSAQYAVLYGPAVLPFLALQAVVGCSLLEVVNYLEHYGPARQRAATGRWPTPDPDGDGSVAGPRR
ncbi:hypothetical protein [Micromonospora sp. NPDC049801]|uniref:hypothetical protein n=1 Tax=unclassified Micromonospora TaxID=2617518 RepID=UPI0033F34868